MNYLRGSGALAMAATLALWLSAAAPSRAADAEPTPGEPTPADLASAPEPAEMGWNAVSDGDLLKRGSGLGPLGLIGIAAADLDSEVKDNHVGDYVTTGDVSLSDSALRGVSGVNQFTINTGNNNSIQSNLFVIINFE